jgi:hypothetical protein
MYARLSEIFGVAPGTNIWRGKALVLVFLQRETYNKFEQDFFHSDASKTGGRCHESSNGDVQIAFYRESDDRWFAHVLVHESTHGFLHRYRSAAGIPSWANEGLAEYIAFELVEQSGAKQANMAEARTDLQAHKDLSDFFAAAHIDNERYAVARTLTEFMITRDKAAYVKFINGIKDGMEVAESLQKSYGATLEQIVEAYAQWLGVKGGVRRPGY